MKILKKHLSNTFKALAIVASLGSLILFPQQPSFADDTELFTQPPGAVQPPPNVMFLIDNSTNWERQSGSFSVDPVYGVMDYGRSELRAIRDVVIDLKRRVNVGIAMHDAQGSTYGGYIRMGARDMSDPNNKAHLTNMVNRLLDKTKVNNLNASGESVNTKGKNPSAAMYELYRYFSGSTNFQPLSTGSDPSAKADYAGNAEAGSTAYHQFTSGFGIVKSSATSGQYVSPLSTAVPCARNYIIFISNNSNNYGSDGDQTIGGLKVGSQMQLGVVKKDASSNWFDEWAKYLYAQGVPVPSGGTTPVNGKITTYTIDVFNDEPDNPDYSLLLQNAARVSGGRYFAAKNYNVLVQSINDIFNEIQAVNSVFASVALPVSVNVRGTNLNQVYLGVFRPDRNSAPNWPGNVKQYKLGLDGNQNLIMVDKNGAVALGANGFFQSGAVSYWTSNNTYWDFDPDSNSSAPTSDAPDGPLVERGGVNQVLRWDSATGKLKAASARNVYTYTSSSPSMPTSPVSLGSSHLFETTNTDSELQKNSNFSASSNAEREEIINWVRGQDLGDENQNGSPTDLRARAHGDVVHSRPAVINYNRYGDDNDVVVFYGANDGLLHAVQGGQSDNPPLRIAGGAEYWSFAAEEFFPKFRRMRNNTPKISWADTGVVTPPVYTTKFVSGSSVGVIKGSAMVSSGMQADSSGSPQPLASGTTVSAVSTGGALKLSSNVSSASVGATVTLTPQPVANNLPTGSPTADSKTIGISGSIPGSVVPGMYVSGTGIPADAKIVSISFDPVIKLTAPATATSNEVATFSLISSPSAWFASGQNRVFFRDIPGNTSLRAQYGIVNGLEVVGTGVAAGAKISNDFATSGHLLTLSAAPSQTGFFSGITATKMTAVATDGTATADNAAFNCAANASGCSLSIKANGAAAAAAADNMTPGRYVRITGASGALFEITANSGSGSPRTITVRNTTASPVSISKSSMNNAALPIYDFSSASFNAILTGNNKAIVTDFNSGSAVSLASGVALTFPVGGPTGLTVSSFAADAVAAIQLNSNNVATNVGSGGNGATLGFRYTTTAPVQFTAGSTNAIIGSADIETVGIMSRSVAGSSNVGVATSGTTLPGGTKMASAASSPQIVLDKDVSISAGVALTAYIKLTGVETFAGNGFIKVNAAELENSSGTSLIRANAGTGAALTYKVDGVGVAATTTTVDMEKSATFVVFGSSASSTDEVQVAYSTAGATGESKPYFFDGPIGVYRHDAPNTGAGATAAQGDGKIVAGSCNASDSTDCDKVLIYVPMRRGGRVIYAFDVTDPAAPKFMWKIGNTSTGFEELGQTWSTPTPVDMKIGSVVKPVLIFGGGYDAAIEDKDPRTGTRTMGRAVYFVDAKTGALIKVFKGSGTTAMGSGATGGMTSDQAARATELTCAVPSDIAVLSKDPVSGFAQPAFRMYFGDTCAQVWRIDTADTNPDNWVITRLANVGIKAATHGPAVPTPAGAYAHDRKFLFAPDVVYGGNDGHPFHYVLMGSGDREHPFNGYGDAAHPDSQAVTNRFYMFKDFNVLTNGKIYSHASGEQLPVVPHNISYDSDPSAATSMVTITGALPYTEEHLYDATADLIQISGATADQKKVATLATDAYYGWYITLEKGEKVVGGATTSAGSVFFGTNIPTPNTAACNNNLGEARLYQVNIKNGAAIPPSPLSPIDSISARYQVVPGGGLPPTPVPVSVIIDGKFKEGVIAGTSVVQPQDTVVGSRLRVYNRKVIDR